MRNINFKTIDWLFAACLEYLKDRERDVKQ
jgi:hypothetical protein